MELEMSRYIITVTGRGQSDAEAVIGYDRPLQTFFLQAFPDEEGEDLGLWLGTEYRAFETLTALRAVAVAQGYDFMPLPSDILWSLVNDRSREAIRSLPDDVVDQLLNGSQPPE
jgi:hypothetical protein